MRGTGCEVRGTGCEVRGAGIEKCYMINVTVLRGCMEIAPDTGRIGVKLIIWQLTIVF